MADFDIDTILNLSIAIVFFLLLLLFIFQTMKKKRSAPYFIISLFFGFIGGVFAYFDSIGLFDNEDLVLAIQLTCYSLQFVFFFLFMETLQYLKLNAKRWSIILVLFIIQQFALWRNAYFSVMGGYNNPALNFWVWADFGYDNLALYTFLIIGFPIYAKMYRYTKETRPLIMSIALIIVSLGFCIISASDYLSYFGATVDWLDNISILGDVLPLTGLLLFLLSYITDIDYLYRLPSDNYILMVSYKSGVTIHSVRFKTRSRHVEIDENLLSGLFTGITMVFKNVLESHEDVQSILSKDATILMQSGKYVTAIIVADNISAILDRSLKRYVEEFENKFQEKLESEDKLISDFDSATELLKPIFPYLVVRE